MPGQQLIWDRWNCPVLSQVTDDWHLNLHFALTTWRAWQEVPTTGVQARHFPTSSDEGWQREVKNDFRTMLSLPQALRKRFRKSFPHGSTWCMNGKQCSVGIAAMRWNADLYQLLFCSFALLHGLVCKGWLSAIKKHFWSHLEVWIPFSFYQLFQMREAYRRDILYSSL